jgi:putative NIF3 family GTP cyclohydrolase 1 type 2
MKVLLLPVDNGRFASQPDAEMITSHLHSVIAWQTLLIATNTFWSPVVKATPQRNCSRITMHTDVG